MHAHAYGIIIYRHMYACKQLHTYALM